MSVCPSSSSSLLCSLLRSSIRSVLHDLRLLGEHVGPHRLQAHSVSIALRNRHLSQRTMVYGGFKLSQKLSHSIFCALLVQLERALGQMSVPETLCDGHYRRWNDKLKISFICDFHAISFFSYFFRLSFAKFKRKIAGNYVNSQRYGQNKNAKNA